MPDTSTPNFPTPTPIGGDSWANRALWLKNELETKDGWWKNYKYQDSYWKLIFALAFDWELGPSQANKDDQNLRDGFAEAMARKAWSFSSWYGGIDIGFSMFIGSRDAVTIRYSNVVHRGLPLDSQIVLTDSVKKAFDNEANKFYTEFNWRKWDREKPWDWGNPTSSSPKTLLDHLQRGVKIGRLDEDLWYYKGGLNVAVSQYKVNNVIEYVYPGKEAPAGAEWILDIYNMIMVITPGQTDYHCGGHSCVKE